MQTIPLFTSVPPRMTRIGRDGSDIGAAYQKYCMASWTASGFEPVSLNSVAERPMIEDRMHGTPGPVRHRWLERDAAGLYGKPVPFLGDFLAEIGENHSGVIAITNADIVTDLTPYQRETLRGLRRDQCVVLKRRDVRRTRSRSGHEYRGGYDFFAFHAEVLKGFSARQFAIGMPWWDHFLPLWLMFRGLRPVDLGTGIYHRLHEERWTPGIANDIARNFPRLLAESLALTGGLAPDFAAYGDLATNARSYAGLPLRQRLGLIGALLLEGTGASPEGLFQGRLSRLNVNTIDAWRGKTPPYADAFHRPAAPDAPKKRPLQVPLPSAALGQAAQIG